LQAWPSICPTYDCLDRANLFIWLEKGVTPAPALYKRRGNAQMQLLPVEVETDPGRSVVGRGYGYPSANWRIKSSEACGLRAAACIRVNASA
jgi:hypothetical protein